MRHERPSKKARRQEHTSVILQKVLDEMSETQVSIGYLIGKLRRRSFGGVLIILAAIGLVPGVSIFSGLVMAVLAAQIIFGFDAPRFPRFLRDREFETSLVKGMGEKCLRVIRYLESYVTPRWLVMTIPPVLNLLGIVMLALSLVIMLPLPFSNMPPAIALLILSVGLLERDGVMIVLGLLVAVVALVIGWLIAAVAMQSVTLFFD